MDGSLPYYTDGTDVFEWDTAFQADTGTVFAGCSMYGGAVSPDGSRLLCVEEYGPLKVYDTSDGSLLGTLNLGEAAVAVSPDGSKAYLPDGNIVEVVDLATVSDLPGNISMSGNGGRGIAIAPAQPEPTPTPTASPTPSPTPTPTATPTQAPAGLPPTGGEPASGNGLDLIPILLAAALAAAGGTVAFLTLRRQI